MTEISAEAWSAIAAGFSVLISVAAWRQVWTQQLTERRKLTLELMAELADTQRDGFARIAHEDHALLGFADWLRQNESEVLRGVVRYLNVFDRIAIAREAGLLDEELLVSSIELLGVTYFHLDYILESVEERTGLPGAFRRGRDLLHMLGHRLPKDAIDALEEAHNANIAEAAKRYRGLLKQKSKQPFPLVPLSEL